MSSAAPASSPRGEGKERDPEAFEWAKEYEPWPLFLQACAIIGGRAFILIYVYLQICPWNPQWHLVTMYCRPETIGGWAYPCEASKACVRAFPLLAASISCVITWRYILQRRLYYHMLMNKGLLDFANYTPTSDASSMIIGICFVFALSHFALDLMFPPYMATWALTCARIAHIGSVYLVPCCIFIALFYKFVRIEDHLVPMSVFWHDNAEWARAHLSASKLYTDMSILDVAKKVQRKLRQENPDQGYTMDALICKTMDDAETHGELIRRLATRTMDEDHEHEAWYRHLLTEGMDKIRDARKTFSDLFQGLWPAWILLDRHLCDEKSKTFRRTNEVFATGFYLTQFLVFCLLSFSFFHEVEDVCGIRLFESSFNRIRVDDDKYQWLGKGYCRDESFQRPAGYWHDGDTWNAHSCGYFCSKSAVCIGFANASDSCSIYTKEGSAPPAGFRAWNEAHARSASVRRATQLVQTNGYFDADCWLRVQTGGQTEDVAGAIVYLLHMLLVLWIITRSGNMIYHVTRKDSEISEHMIQDLKERPPVRYHQRQAGPASVP